MTITQLIDKLKRIKAAGLPRGHTIESGLSDPLQVLGPLEDGGREVLHEIELE
jgi:hypothetical protein